MTYRPDLTRHQRGPVFICYDQEPLLPDYNQAIFDRVKEMFEGPYILLTTEKNSDAKNAILAKNGFVDCYYFFHIFAAADWYRGNLFDSRYVPIPDRNIEKTYITFNRITSNDRVYRRILVSSLAQHGLLDQGFVSYSKICPDTHRNHIEDLLQYASWSAQDMSAHISTLNTVDDLRIDTAHGHIPNDSYQLSAMDYMQRSFVNIVTETCYWGRKLHLTEKIFKPIVARMPFILLGPAHNLAYLKSYGFQTFDRWWDESYDSEEDDIKRIDRVISIIKSLADRDHKEMLLEMQPVLEHNYRLFNSQEFVQAAWHELVTNLRQAIVQSGTDLLN